MNGPRPPDWRRLPTASEDGSATVLVLAFAMALVLLAAALATGVALAGAGQRVLVGLHVYGRDGHWNHHDELGEDHADHRHGHAWLLQDFPQGAGHLDGCRLRMGPGKVPPDVARIGPKASSM